MKKTTKKSYLLLIIVIFFWYAQYVYIPFQTPYLIGIHVSVNMIGIIMGAYGISQFILRFPMGILADIKQRHKIFIVTGCALTALASIVRVFFTDGMGFLVGNIISGFASATWISFMVLFLSFYPKSQRTVATCRIIMANNLGMFLAFLSSTLLFEFGGMVFICVLSVISGVVATGLALGLSYPHKLAKPTPVRLLLTVFSNRKLLFFAFLALIQQGIQMSTTMSFTNQIIKGLGASAFVIGLSSLIYMLSSVCFAKIGSSPLCNKLCKATWITLSFVLLAAYCFFVPMATTFWLILGLQIIPGISTGILFSFLTAEAMQGVSRRVNSTAMGLFQAIYAIGMTLFPIVVGYLSKIYSLGFAYAVLGGIALFASGLYLVSLKTSAVLD